MNVIHHLFRSMFGIGGLGMLLPPFMDPKLLVMPLISRIMSFLRRLIGALINCNFGTGDRTSCFTHSDGLITYKMLIQPYSALNFAKIQRVH